MCTNVRYDYKYEETFEGMNPERQTELKTVGLCSVVIL